MKVGLFKLDVEKEILEIFENSSYVFLNFDDFCENSINKSWRIRNALFNLESSGKIFSKQVGMKKYYFVKNNFRNSRIKMEIVKQRILPSIGEIDFVNALDISSRMRIPFRLIKRSIYEIKSREIGLA